MPLSIEEGGQTMRPICIGAFALSMAATMSLAVCSAAGARVAGDDLRLGDKVPNKGEKDVGGAATKKIKRGTPEFVALQKNNNPDIVFKDEEKGEADHYMTDRLKEKADELAKKVKAEWPGKKLRITEAWDEQDEHSANSTHYEARAADITVSDQDPKKLGRLGRLAVEAGFDWVFYEDASHIHASVK